MRTCGKLRLIREPPPRSRLYVTLSARRPNIQIRYSRLSHSIVSNLLFQKTDHRPNFSNLFQIPNLSKNRARLVTPSKHPLSTRDRDISAFGRSRAAFICNSMLLPIIFRLNRGKYHLASHLSSIIRLSDDRPAQPTPPHPSLPIPRLSLPWRSGTTINNQHPREQRGGAGERERRRRRKG